jgi:hypothetical protein
MVMTALDASMVTAMFAFVWIKLSRYGRQEDWQPWFEEGEALSQSPGSELFRQHNRWAGCERPQFSPF